MFSYQPKFCLFVSGNDELTSSTDSVLIENGIKYKANANLKDTYYDSIQYYIYRNEIHNDCEAKTLFN